MVAAVIVIGALAALKLLRSVVDPPSDHLWSDPSKMSKDALRSSSCDEVPLALQPISATIEIAAESLAARF